MGSNVDFLDYRPTFSSEALECKLNKITKRA